MQSLRGKTVLVTGASSGIGRATARAFAAEGMRVAISTRSADKLAELAKELGPHAISVPADLTQPDDVIMLAETVISGLGHIDVLFANAGVYIPGLVASGDPDAWDQLMMLNVNSIFRLIRHTLPHMQARKSGDILITSSISAHQALHFEPVYSASKHALRAFAHGLRRQVLRDNIRVGSIAPATVLNELWGSTDENAIQEKIDRHEGLRSEDIAEVAIFMLSRSPHITIRDLVILPQAWDY